MPTAVTPHLVTNRQAFGRVVVHLDFETRSEADIKKVGGALYAAHPSTRIICLVFAVNDDEPILITESDLRDGLSNPKINKLFQLCADPDVVFAAHNAAFERHIWLRLMHEVHGFPNIEIGRWKCTLAKALSYGLPGSLDEVGERLRLNFKKNPRGKELIRLLCVPKSDGTFWTPAEKPAEFQEFYQYCIDDVKTEREADKTLRDLSPTEKRVWEIDQAVNDRGLLIDVPMVIKAIQFADEHSRRMKRAYKEATKGAVESPLQRKKAVDWLNNRGVNVDNTRKATVRVLLENEDSLPEDVLEALHLTAQGTKTSLAKYKKFIQRMDGGVVRELLQYWGAHTGRWAGRGVQIQNLPRPMIDIKVAIQALMQFDYDTFQFFYDNVAEALSWIIRGAIIARPGRILRVADFSQMEARFLAWLAGQENKLELFRRGIDLYCAIASTIYGYEVNKKQHPEQRQVGKVADLALGYGGGIGAFITMAKAYGVDLMAIAPSILRSATGEELESALWTYEKHYLPRNAEPAPKIIALAADIIKQRWRRANPKIVQFWHDLENSVIEAIQTGRPVQCGKLLFFMNRQFLHCKLPSGRLMTYPYPRVREDSKGKLTIVYLSARGWRNLYGGKIAENVTQAGQRDLLSESQIRLTDAGHTLLFHAHDENICEDPIGFSDLSTFMGIMAQAPAWAAGLPIAVSGWEGGRYGKE